MMAVLKQWRRGWMWDRQCDGGYLKGLSQIRTDLASQLFYVTSQAPALHSLP